MGRVNVVLINIEQSVIIEVHLVGLIQFSSSSFLFSTFSIPSSLVSLVRHCCSLGADSR